MNPQLPRELLWTDKTNLTEFLNNEPGGYIVSLYNMGKKKNALKLTSPMMLFVLNETFYYSTRIVYEHNYNATPDPYIKEISDTMGDKDLTKLVLQFMYMLLTIQSDKSKELLHFIDLLNHSYFRDYSFRLVAFVNKLLKPGRNKDAYRLKPCPWPVDSLIDLSIDWQKITNNFSRQTITKIISLWDDDREKAKAIKLIENAYNACQPQTEDIQIENRADRSFFIRQKNAYASNVDKDTSDVTIISADEDITPKMNPIEACFEEILLSREDCWQLYFLMLAMYARKIYTDKHVKNFIPFLKEQYPKILEFYDKKDENKLNTSLYNMNRRTAHSFYDDVKDEASMLKYIDEMFKGENKKTIGSRDKAKDIALKLFLRLGQRQ